MADLSIMYQPIAGGWVKLGTQTGGGRGVLPESIQLEGDRGEGGCHAASFRLKQDPRWINGEMQQFTPIAVWDGAECVWSGRVIEAPTTFGEDDIEVVVQCEGWWQHLKDDCTDREWVIDDLSRFQSIASRPTTTLSAINLAAGVEANDGAVVLSIAKNNELTINRGSGVVMDLGPTNRAKRVAVSITHNGLWGSSQCYLLVRGSDTEDPISGGGTEDVYSAYIGTAATLTPSGTFSTARRFVSVFWFWVAATTNAGADGAIRLNSCRVFTDAADESGGASVLKASTVIGETLDTCAPLISPRRDRITTTSLNLPQFPGSPGYRYAHELVKQANAYHGYIARLTPDPKPVFEYFPVPTDYRFVVGEGEYTLLEPAAQDGRAVASRVITEFEDASGVRSYAESSVPTNAVYATAASQLSNPSFDTNTTGWSNISGSIARDTGVFDTTPASLSLTRDAYTESFATNLVVGTAYRIIVRTRISSGTNGVELYVTPTGSAWTVAAGRVAVQDLFVSTTWKDIAIDFVANATSVRLSAVSTGFAGYPAAVYIDSIRVEAQMSNVVVRRGFRRTFLRPMTQRSTAATAQAIADLELDNAQYPPFKGTITVTGTIPLKGGGHLDVAHLAGMTGENILLKNLHDPNSQALGRIGNIQSVVYDHNKRRAMIGIDRDLRFVSELRNRLELFAR